MDTTYRGIDCATPLNASTARQIASAGFSFVGRYLTPDSATYRWKRLMAAEAQIISDAGLYILAVFETSDSRALGGASNGLSDGAAAYNAAQEVGMTAGSCIWFAVDCDARSDDMGPIEAYLRAAKGQIGGYRIGVYGSYSVVEAMNARGAADKYWQCMAWSGGKLAECRNVYQYEAGQAVAGINVDLDEAYSLDGMWNLNTQEETEVRYNSIDEIPDYGKATIKKLIDRGILSGDGSGLNLSEDMVRILVINDRMGLYK